MTIEKDDTAWIHPTTVFEGTASIGFCSRVGHDADDEEPSRIGNGVKIGTFCLIEGGVHLADNVEVDHYCRISWGTKIGTKTRILYGAKVYDKVTIGKNCIVSGEIVDRAIIGDNVTFQGEMAHAHADATGDWDETEEPSPTILSGSVVAVGAIVIGGIKVGPSSYIAAGERVRCDVPREMVHIDGELKPLSSFRGLIKVRTE